MRKGFSLRRREIATRLEQDDVRDHSPPLGFFGPRGGRRGPRAGDFFRFAKSPAAAGLLPQGRRAPPGLPLHGFLPPGRLESHRGRSPRSDCDSPDSGFGFQPSPRGPLRSCSRLRQSAPRGGPFGLRPSPRAPPRSCSRPRQSPPRGGPFGFHPSPGAPRARSCSRLRQSAPRGGPFGFQPSPRGPSRSCSRPRQSPPRGGPFGFQPRPPPPSRRESSRRPSVSRGQLP